MIGALQRRLFRQQRPMSSTRSTDGSASNCSLRGATSSGLSAIEIAKYALRLFAAEFLLQLHAFQALRLKIQQIVVVPQQAQAERGQQRA